MCGVVGVGNMPDLPQQGWLPWLRQQRKKGLQVCFEQVLAWHLLLTCMNGFHSYSRLPRTDAASLFTQAY